MKDRDAVRVALYIALDTERALVDAYDALVPDGSGTRLINDAELGVISARKNIAAFKRVLRTRYGHTVLDCEQDEARK